MTELEYRQSIGQRHVSLEKLIEEYAALGYRFDRSMDCIGRAEHLTGPMAGTSYVANSLYPVQIDNGLSAWHVDARRDTNYTKLQALRNEIFATDKLGRFIEV